MHDMRRSHWIGFGHGIGQRARQYPARTTTHLAIVPASGTQVIWITPSLAPPGTGHGIKRAM
jgi:hypothetical protein